jgi:hypothetical protein
VLEYVAWDDRMPILLQPCGAVPKGTAPFYRLITDARFANKFYSDWGVTFTTAAQLCSTLNRCDFHFSIDISDAYHLSLWAGCGGGLRPVQRPIIVSNGPGQPSEVSWVDAMVNGCTPSTCRGGCDKDLSGVMIHGFVFRFAACQFGQKTAGSPLGSIVRAVARYFARLLDPVHVASWVDDLIFIMSTPEHGGCAAFVGGFCPVCTEYHGRALKVQEMWHAKARKLNIPLSAKGHLVGQSGAFTGVAIDSFQGRFSMLPDKMASLAEARAGRVRGLHPPAHRSDPGQGAALRMRHTVYRGRRTIAVAAHTRRGPGRGPLAGHGERAGVRLGHEGPDVRTGAHSVGVHAHSNGAVRRRGAASPARRAQLSVRSVPGR